MSEFTSEEKHCFGAPVSHMGADKEFPLENSTTAEISYIDGIPVEITCTWARRTGQPYPRIACIASENQVRSIVYKPSVDCRLAPKTIPNRDIEPIRVNRT